MNIEHTCYLFFRQNCQVWGGECHIIRQQRSGLPGLTVQTQQFTLCWDQCVTIPKIWTKPNPKLFSDTKFFRYRIRYFFRYQIFTIPNPILFTIPNFFDTESETTKKMEKFRNREVLKPKRHTLVGTNNHSASSLIISKWLWMDLSKLATFI